MTAVHAPGVTSRATRLERLILELVTRVERAVTSHVERRSSRTGSLAAQEAAADARADARALGSIGILPR